MGDWEMTANGISTDAENDERSPSKIEHGPLLVHGRSKIVFRACALLPGPRRVLPVLALPSLLTLDGRPGPEPGPLARTLFPAFRPVDRSVTASEIRSSGSYRRCSSMMRASTLM